MKRIVAAIIAAAMASGASAAYADPMGTAAPGFASPSYFDWSGFYAGVNLGVGLGQNPTTFSTPGSSNFQQFDISKTGAAGGGQFGYNFQSGSWVIGVESDIQGVTPPQGGSSPCAGNCLGTDRYLTWFGTTRARLGYGAGPVLSYVTGGLAYGGVRAVEKVITGGNITTPVDTTQAKAGWTLGSGVEASLGGNWTGRIEYLYVDLGSISEDFVAFGYARHVSTDAREHVFRLGANYQLGNRAAYVLPPSADWRGFYLGGNFGAGIARDRYRQTVALDPPFTAEFSTAPRGYLGGAQAGYNWQVASWVIGLETDIQGTTQKENWTCYFGCQVRDSQELPWFGTTRVRMGYDIGRTLFYATGGLAYGQLRVAIADALGQPQSTDTFSHTGIGWTAGAGIESPLEFLGRNWTAKVEYLYIDLGSATEPTVSPAPPPGLYVFDQVTSSYSTQIHEHVFRTGLNYHFDALPGTP